MIESKDENRMISLKSFKPLAKKNLEKKANEKNLKI